MDLSHERKLITLLAVVQIMHILDFVIMMPLGPVFIREFSITSAQFGEMVSAYNFAAAISAFLFTLVADMFERKKTLILFFVGFILGTSLCAVASNYQFMVAARILAGFFGGTLNAVVLAIVAEVIPYERRGNAMGVIMSSFSIASVAGVPIGLAIADFSSWHFSFVFISVLSVLTLIPMFKIVPIINTGGRQHILQVLKTFGRILSKRDYLWGYLAIMILPFSAFIIIPYISPYVVQNVGLLESDLKFIYLVGGAFTVVSARLIGRLTDKYGAPYLFVGLALISFIPIYIFTNLGQASFAATIALTTFFMMILSGRFIPLMTLVSELPTGNERGGFMSLQNSLRSLATAMAALVAGKIIVDSPDGTLHNMEKIGYTSITLTVVTIFVVFVIKKILKGRNESHRV
jgi:DHA1 family inner membrane transport protein